MTMLQASETWLFYAFFGYVLNYNISVVSQEYIYLFQIKKIVSTSKIVMTPNIYLPSQNVFFFNRNGFHSCPKYFAISKI